MSRLSLAIVATAVMASGVGCASFKMPFAAEKPDLAVASAKDPVMEIITLWQPGDGRGPDNLPTRGFAGQLLFFTYHQESPAIVNGTTTVYVFDDQGSNAEQSTPLWQHTFAPEEWHTFARETNLGVAYQLFVPYVRKGTHTARCAVRIKFEPTDGGTPVYSKLTNVTLEGDDMAARRKSKLEHKRIEPARVENKSPAELQTSTMPLLRDHRGNSASVSRLKQMAQQMVLEQQQGHIQQAGYLEPAALPLPTEPDSADEPEPLATGRYRLHQ